MLCRHPKVDNNMCCSRKANSSKVSILSSSSTWFRLRMDKLFKYRDNLNRMWCKEPNSSNFNNHNSNKVNHSRIHSNNNSLLSDPVVVNR